MPKTTASAGKPTTTTTKKPRKSSKVLIIIAVIAVPVVLLGFSLWWADSGSKLAIQDTMEQYLEDKYDKDFTVEEPKLEGSGLGVSGSYRADAYPNDDASLVFMVGETQNTGKHFDSYSQTVWHREEEPRVKAFIASLNPPMTDPKVRLTTLIPTAQEPDPIRGEVPSIEETIKQYPDKFLYDIAIIFSVNDLQDEQTKGEVRSQYLALYNFINSKGVAKPNLTLSISSLNNHMGYSCKSSRISHFGTTNNLLDNCLKEPSRRGIY